MNPVLTTARLHLRQVQPSDAPFVFELMNEPVFLRHIGDRGIRTEADARAYIENKMVPRYSQHGYGMYVVEPKTARGALGVCGFVKRDVLDHPDIGFAFLQRHCFCGYGSESARMVLDYGQSQLGFRRIYGVTSPANAPSIRVLERLGFGFERMILLSGDKAEIQLYARNLPST